MVVQIYNSSIWEVEEDQDQEVSPCYVRTCQYKKQINVSNFRKIWARHHNNNKTYQSREEMMKQLITQVGTNPVQRVQDQFLWNWDGRTAQSSSRSKPGRMLSFSPPSSWPSLKLFSLVLPGILKTQHLCIYLFLSTHYSGPKRDLSGWKHMPLSVLSEQVEVLKLA